MSPAAPWPTAPRAGREGSAGSVAWEALAAEHMPRSVMPGTEGQWAVIDAIKFPEGPDDIALKDHEVCFHFKSGYGLACRSRTSGSRRCW